MIEATNDPDDWQEVSRALECPKFPRKGSTHRDPSRACLSPRRRAIFGPRVFCRILYCIPTVKEQATSDLIVSMNFDTTPCCAKSAN